MHTATTDRRRASRSRPVVVRIAAALGAAALVTTTAACAGAEPAGSATLGTTTVAGTTTDTPAGPELTAEDVDAWLEETLPAALEENEIAGASVAVVHDGEVLTARGFGLADTGTGGGTAVEADGDTLFRPGSISKVFTATAVMQLVEQGELDLDTDVSEYLDFELNRNFPADITLRNLLTHTAGFEERLRGMIGEGSQAVDLREFLATDPPEQVYAPGTTPSYSNYGNALAGYIVERVSGEPFADYVGRHVFEPLGMDSSTFHQPLPADLAGRMSGGYVDDSQPAQPFEMVKEVPAGGLSASAEDMARFMLAQAGAAGQDAPLSDETREQMHSPGLTAADLGTFAEVPRMTLGLFQADRNGHRIVAHGGDTNYFHSYMQILPDDGAGFYISLNSGGIDPLVTHELRRGLAEEFTDRYFPAPAASAEGPATAVGQDDESEMRAAAEQLAGRYTSSRGFHSTFLASFDPFLGSTLSVDDGGRLLLDPDPATQRPGVYEQVDEHVWQEVDGDRQLGVRTENGQVTGIVFDNAFTLLPLDADRRTGPVVLGAATAVLLVVLLAWPVGAIVRRVRVRLGRVERPTPVRADRWTVLTRVGVISTLAAVAGWVAIMLSIVGGTDVAPLLIRGVQGLQVVGALGMVPAAISLINAIRRRAGWRAITTGSVTLAALSAVMNVAIMFQMFAPNISY